MDGRWSGPAHAVALAASWIAGVLLQLQQPRLLPGAAYAAAFAAAAAVLVLMARWTNGGSPLRRITACVAVAVLAGSGTGWRAGLRLDDRLATELEGRDLIVTAEVDGLPAVTEYGLRLRLRIESARTRDDDRPARVPPFVSVGWYAGNTDPERLSSVRAGQRWRLPVRLRRPHGLGNPQGFDLELWLFEQGLGATGAVRPPRVAPAERLEDARLPTLDGWRQDVREAIAAHVRDPAAAGVLAALVIGDQGAILRGDWDVFRATGVAHLMSISGLHITMLAWLAAAACRHAWSRSMRLTLWRPAPAAARWVGLATALAYAMVAGFGVPAQRTVWMLACVTLLRSLGRAWPWPLVLGCAAWVVAAVDPWALLQPGFWLSFVAVGLLMASDPGTAAARPAGIAGHAAHGLRSQVIATIGLAPLSMVLFQQLSLVGFAANLVAVPLVTLVITPLALLGVAVPALWVPAALLVDVLARGLGAAAAWPGAVLWLAVAPAWAQLAALAGGALAVAPLPWKARLAGLPLLLPQLAAAPPPLPDGRFEMLAVDVGQGTAVLLRTRRHTLLYDSGPMYSPGSDAGQRVLLPLLRSQGVARLDLLMLSHRDSDHVGGAAALMRALPVARLSSSLEDDHPLQRPGARRCSAGQAWDWDGVSFEVLHPEPGDERDATRPNALSCVLRVSGQGGSALLAGDIEAAQERRLVERVPERLRADVLLVPHHGSRTSSTAAFIDAVAPRVAVVQAGYRSRFGHPAAEVVWRYAERDIKVLRSDRCGAWRWGSGPDDGICWRDAARRYWRHPDTSSPSTGSDDDDPSE